MFRLIEYEQRSRKKIESYNWTDWTSFPIPSDCGWIEGSNKNNLRQIFRKILCKPDSIGVYQLRDVKLNKNILFGITTLQTLEKRMASLLPTKFGGISGRNNETKKNYICQKNALCLDNILPGHL